MKFSADPEVIFNTTPLVLVRTDGHLYLFNLLDPYNVKIFDFFVNFIDKYIVKFGHL